MLSVQPKGKQKGCAGCNRKIKDRYLLKALDQYWHEDCLKCACCDCRLGEVGSTLYTKANLILCRRDYLRWAASPTPHAPWPCRPESPLLHAGPALPCFSPHTQSPHILAPMPRATRARPRPPLSRLRPTLPGRATAASSLLGQDCRVARRVSRWALTIPMSSLRHPLPGQHHAFPWPSVSALCLAKGGPSTEPTAVL